MSHPDVLAIPPALQFSNVSVARAGRLILTQVSFAVPAGGVVAVLGANGSGKTTLIQAALGLLPLVAGQVRVFGGTSGTSGTRGAQDRMGYVPQDYSSGAAEEGIRALDAVQLGLTGHRWGCRRATVAQRSRAHHILNAVGAGDFMRSRLSSLSGGQRQRVAIAAALVSAPRVLILDEPLAALDLRSQRETVVLLARLHAELGVTILVVAHDLNPLLPILDSAICVHGGRARYAPVADVLDNQLLSEMYGTPVEVVHTPQGARILTSVL